MGADTGKVRQGTGKIIKFFRVGQEPMSKLKAECDELTDQDIQDLVTAIDGDGSY